MYRLVIISIASSRLGSPDFYLKTPILICIMRTGFLPDFDEYKTGLLLGNYFVFTANSVLFIRGLAFILYLKFLNRISIDFIFKWTPSNEKYSKSWVFHLLVVLSYLYLKKPLSYVYLEIFSTILCPARNAIYRVSKLLPRCISTTCFQPEKIPDTLLTDLIYVVYIL